MTCYQPASFRTYQVSVNYRDSLAYSSEILDIPEPLDILLFPKNIYETLFATIRSNLFHFETDYSTTFEKEYSIPTESFPFSFDFLNRLSIPNIVELCNFIDQHDDILPVMLFGCKITTEKFGSDSELSLNVVHDPESNFKFLELNVRKPEYEDNFMETIESLCDSFWNDLENKSSYFIITTDFQSPIEKK